MGTFPTSLLFFLTWTAGSFFHLSMPLTFLCSGLFCLSQADSYPFLPYGLEEFPNGHSDLYHAARKLWVLFLRLTSLYFLFAAIEFTDFCWPELCQMCQVQIFDLAPTFSWWIWESSQGLVGLVTSAVHGWCWLTGNLDVERLLIKREGISGPKGQGTKWHQTYLLVATVLLKWEESGYSTVVSNVSCETDIP